jgi:hypothetical protein
MATILCAVPAFAQGGSSAVGSWDMTTKSPQGDRTSLLVIKQEGGKLVAAAKGPQGERPYDSVAVNGNDIKLVLTIQFSGSPMVITYTGKIEKDSMKGEADFGGLAQGEWSAVPHKEGAGSGSGSGSGSGAGSGSVTGTWNATVETGQGSGNPVFTFKQDGEKLTGNYKGTFGEAPLTGTVKGSDISFSFKVDVQGQAFEVTYTGKIDGANMKGTAKLGELGDATWSAKKQ